MDRRDIPHNNLSCKCNGFPDTNACVKKHCELGKLMCATYVMVLETFPNPSTFGDRKCCLSDNYEVRIFKVVA